MIAALLHGRTHLNFQEFRQQNHLAFYLHVLGILELLQPRVFQSEHQGALWDCLRSFIRLLLVGARQTVSRIPQPNILPCPLLSLLDFLSAPTGEPRARANARPPSSGFCHHCLETSSSLRFLSSSIPCLGSPTFRTLGAKPRCVLFVGVRCPSLYILAVIL